MIEKMASAQTHLRNAPIVEAMIAFSFAAPVPAIPQVWEEFHARITSDYPARTDLQEAQVTFNADGSTGTTETVGARFTSADGKNVCIVNRDSFICARLHPYESWEALKAEFTKLWGEFSALASPSVTKVAVRYINKLFVPEGSEIFDSVNTYPKISTGLPQMIFNVFVRLELKIPEPNGVLIVTQAQLPPERPGFVALVLDHDLQFPRMDTGWDEWAVLAEARNLKNRYFFASISDELLKEYL